MLLKYIERSEKNLQAFLSLEYRAALSLQPSYHLALPSDDALGFGDLLSGNCEIALCSHKTRLQNLSSEGILPCLVPTKWAGRPAVWGCGRLRASRQSGNLATACQAARFPRRGYLVCCEALPRPKVKRPTGVPVPHSQCPNRAPRGMRSSGGHWFDLPASLPHLVAPDAICDTEPIVEGGPAAKVEARSAPFSGGCVWATLHAS